MSNTNREIKYIKSVFLLGVIGSLPSLFFKEEDCGPLRLGLLIISLCAFHERGQQRRLGSNFFSQVSQNILSKPDASFEALQNTFFNVINGGSAVFDDTASKLNTFMRR